MSLAIRQPLLLAAVLALSTSPAAAQATHEHKHSIRISTDGETEARVVSRMHLRDADFAVVTQRRDAALIIEGDEVVLQLTDRGLEHVKEGMDDASNAKRNVGSRVLANVMVTVLRSTITAMLDHGIAYPIAEIERVRYDGTRLRLVTTGGDELFKHLEINGRDVMEDFSVREAKAFIAAFNKAKRGAK